MHKIFQRVLQKQKQSMFNNNKSSHRVMAKRGQKMKIKKWELQELF